MLTVIFHFLDTGGPIWGNHSFMELNKKTLDQFFFNLYYKLVQSSRSKKQ